MSFVAPLLRVVTVVTLGCMAVGCARLANDPVCVPETRRCAEGTAQFCDEAGHWSLPEICAAGTACLDGTCASACGETCRPSTKRCAPQGVQVCDRGPDGCGQWGPPSPCAVAQRCADGACRSDCPVDCSAGERRCLGGSASVECLVDEACPRFGEPVECPPGPDAGIQVCSGGTCHALGGCADQCREGEWVCLSSLEAQRCERSADGCLDWAMPALCSAEQRCREPEGCGAACVDVCRLGESRCEGGGIVACEAGADGCAVWGAAAACPGGCADGVCLAGCVSECMPGRTRCDGQGVSTCEVNSGCGRWGAAVPCPDGQACQGEGQCGACEPGATEMQSCGNCGTQSRTCGPDGQWLAFGDCMAQGECTPNAEEACGLCGVRRCSPECQWGACDGGGVCSPGAPEPCGRCGTRTCSGACQWDACGGEGVCDAGQQRDCNACGYQGCSAQCQWAPCGNGDGTLHRQCNACGWQFCCPNGNWCGCAAHYDCAAGQSCVGAGVCQ